MNIKENLDVVRKNIEIVCNKIGRNKNDIELVVVTKTVGIGEIKEVIKYGINIVGESKVQDALKKYDLLREFCLEWHFIGHLQTNKIKKVLEFAKLIHSVDTFRLLKDINMYAKEVNKIQNVLLEVNVTGEASKYGLKPEEIDYFVERFVDDKMKNVKILGIMTMAPFTQDKDTIRSCFRDTKQIFAKLKKVEARNISMEILSMGMTNDYEIAIEEGANMLRIGTALFKD